MEDEGGVTLPLSLFDDVAAPVRRFVRAVSDAAGVEAPRLFGIEVPRSDLMDRLRYAERHAIKVAVQYESCGSAVVARGFVTKVAPSGAYVCVDRRHIPADRLLGAWGLERVLPTRVRL